MAHRDVAILAAASDSLAAVDRLIRHHDNLDLLWSPEAVFLRIPLPTELLNEAGDDDGEPDPAPEVETLADACPAGDRDTGPGWTLTAADIAASSPEPEPEPEDEADDADEFWTPSRDLALAESLLRGMRFDAAAAEVGFCDEAEARKRWAVIRPGGLIADQEAMLKRLRAEVAEGAA